MTRRTFLPAAALSAIIAWAGVAAAQDPAGSWAESVIESLNVKRMALSDLTQLLSRGSGRNIVVSQSAAATEVTIYLRNVTVLEGIRAVCDAHKLWYRQREKTGLLVIMTLDEYRAGANAMTEEKVKVISLRYLDTRDAGDALQRLFRSRVVWSRPDDEEGDAIDRMERALERMDAIAERNEELRDDSTSTSSVSRYSSSRYDREQYWRYGRTGRRSDRSSGAPYAAVEPTTAATEKGFTQAELLAARELLQSDAQADARLGARPGVVYISSLAGTNRMMLRSADPASLEQVAAVLREIDRPKPQVLLEVKVLNLQLTDDERYGVDWLFQAGDFSGGRSTGVNSTELGTGFAQIAGPGAGLTPQGTGLDPRALVLSAVTDNVLARIQLLADRGRVTGLATPNLCVADNEASRVFIGEEISILTELEVRSQFNEDGNLVRTDIDPRTERRNVGTSLVITPTIHVDRTATIRLSQEDSVTGNLREIFSFEGQTFQSQDIARRSVTTTVIAKDGQIAAIGGLVRESVEDRRIGIPLLMDLPYIGWLFGTTIKEKGRNELLVLIRPFILLAPGETEKVSEDLLKRISLHPSAAEDLPELGIGRGDALNLPAETAEGLRRKLEGARRSARTWAVETDE
jgi:general secretion pathway protein D